MRTRLREFWSLSCRRQLLLCEATVLIASSKVILAVAGLDVTERCLDVLRRFLLSPWRDASPASVCWAVSTAASHFPGTYDCLDRALAGSVLLAANGYQHHLRLGVDTTSSEFEAHAWIESDGEVLMGNVEDFGRFRELTQREIGG